jgi:hypothetical protein
MLPDVHGHGGASGLTRRYTTIVERHPLQTLGISLAMTANEHRVHVQLYNARCSSLGWIVY